MSKRVKHIAGCTLPSGERLALRRLEDRAGAALISTHLELHCGETVLATGPDDITAALRASDLPAADRRWMFDNMREAVRKSGGT